MTAQEQKEFIIMKEDVKHIKKDVSEINENVLSFNVTVTKLTTKLFNDEDTGEQGYFELTRRNGVRLTKLENLKIAALTIFGAVCGWVGWLWSKLL